MNHSPWICCQLGAREHYAIPRALHQAGRLSSLITDAWVTPQSLFNRLPYPLYQNLRERWHPDLGQANVQGFTAELIQFELSQKLQKRQGWDQIMARNQWFQQRTIGHLERSQPAENSTLFSYSYAALELLRYAKSRGWQTVLGQIDPGVSEEQIVQAEAAQQLGLAPDWRPVPPSYWEIWREECQLADRILVNSVWSAQLLQQAGIDPGKLEIVPLVYAPPSQAQAFSRSYPVQFSQSRPLRALFLGQVTLRKGIAAILEAITLLKDQSIEFWFVGSRQIAMPPELVNHPQVRWIGSVARSQVQAYYQQADLFLFPTLSDGFGLTQLEAQAWKLPILVSQFCGEVVKDQVNGIVLPQVTGRAIADALDTLLANPQILSNLSRQSGDSFRFSLSDLSERLQQISSIC